jgi:hypothetical protein
MIMKKLIGLLFFITLLASSCQKERFEPKEESYDTCTCTAGKALIKCTNDEDDDYTRPITDPNGDEDEDKRPKKK